MSVKVRERPKGSGVYWIFIHNNGKRKAKKVGEKKTANTLAKKIEAKIALKQFNLDEEKIVATFKEYSDTWLEEYIGALREPATKERYETILKHVNPILGSKPINEITRGDVRKLLLQLNKKGGSRSHICLVRDVLSGTLGYAVDEELIAANPVTGILKRLKLERNKQLIVEPMTQAEVGHFLKTCAEREAEQYPFFLCAFRTGMRLGELLALKWSDIDWFSNFIRVEKSYKRGRVSKTKTGKNRRVDMSDQLAEALKSLLIQRKKEALKSGKSEAVEIIFHRKGKHMEQNYIRKVFKRILRKAGIREMRLHDIRHTFASLLLSNGESPVYVKEQLGHSTIQMTVDIYGHLIPGSNRGAVNKLDVSAPQDMGNFQEDTISDNATGRNLYATSVKKKPVIEVITGS